jgi:hypothetical protein
MKNILSYDFNDASKNGLYSVDSGNNSLLIYLTPLNTQITNYIIEITDTQSNVIKSSALSKNENGQLEYSVQESYFNGNAQMKIRLLSSEENSDYIIFNCLSFTGEDLLLKRVNNQYSFSIKLPASSYLYPPVGTQIYNSRKDFDPNEYYPGTKWVRIKGYILGGINEDDTDTNIHTTFNQDAGKTIGSKWLQTHAHEQNVTANEQGNVYRRRDYSGEGYAEIYSQNVSTDIAGSGDGQNIQPTQLTYIWERIA